MHIDQISSTSNVVQRCQYCGMRAGTPHLRNCPIHRHQNSNTPTPRMMDFAQCLAQQLGKDLPDNLDYKQCSDLIDNMKEELGYE